MAINTIVTFEVRTNIKDANTISNPDFIVSHIDYGTGKVVGLIQHNIQFKAFWQIKNFVPRFQGDILSIIDVDNGFTVYNRDRDHRYHSPIEEKEEDIDDSSWLDYDEDDEEEKEEDKTSIRA